MLRILAHTLLSLITLHIQKKDKAVEKKRRLKREQAKAADGYLPKWRSNHLPRRRRERERGESYSFNFDATAVLCCHPAADSGTATSASLSTKWAQLSFLPTDCSHIQTAITAYILRLFQLVTDERNCCAFFSQGTRAIVSCVSSMFLMLILFEFKHLFHCKASS